MCRLRTLNNREVGFDASGFRIRFFTRQQPNRCRVVAKIILKMPRSVHAFGRRIGSRRSKLMQWRRIVRMSVVAVARLAAVDYRVNSPLIFRLCLVVVGGIFVGVIQCRAPVIAGEFSVP